MGFSTAAVNTLFFIAFIAIFGALYGAYTYYETNIDKALDSKTNFDETYDNLEMTLVNAVYNRVDGNLTVRISNTGTVTMDLKNTVGIIGTDIYSTNITKRVDGRNISYWAPGHELELTINTPSLYFGNISNRISSISGIFEHPQNLSAYNNYTYVVDNEKIIVVDANGSYVKSFTLTNTDYPRDVTVYDDELFISDNNSAIDVYNTSGGTYIKSISTNITVGSIHGIYANSSYLYIANGTHGVIVLNHDGTYVETIYTGITNATDVYVDKNIYVLDSGNHVLKFYPNGSLKLNITGLFSTAIRIAVSDESFSDPFIMILDNSKVYVYDTINGTYLGSFDVTGNDFTGFDWNGKLYMSGGLSGYKMAKNGCPLKIVMYNGKSITIIL